MDDADPITTFFPDATESTLPTILYTTLSLTSSASAADIRKSYRRLALQFHPDKHSSKPESERETLSKQFQRVGFAYAVLSDESRRKRYDETGRTDERFAGAEEMGWDAYFEGLYKRVDRKILDEDKKKYQGSDEEKDDIISAYNSTSGSLPDILSYIPHSSHTDESRFITLINSLIADGELESTPKWKKTSTDEKARAKRAKAGEKAAKEAEKAAKELGVWDEFYGSGKKGKRQSDKNKEEEGGEGALQALILKRQRERESAFDAMEEKYRRLEEESRAKKKAKKGKGTKKETEGMPKISDADFEALQAKMFGTTDSGDSTKAPKKSKKSKA
ncbi:DNAJ domain-containing protein [Cryptococcus neoformans Gb118]|nr:DNAJ domain-containing protein [Cryptococcus neoformans var. grubii MW-RSA36]OXL07070.1 DNAJ domain-containing protein [Cryptococcus neoformans var. grubii Gb118]